MKAVIFGATGQLGRDLLGSCFANHFCKIICPSHNECPIENYSVVADLIIYEKPDFVFNFAALHNVALCEEAMVKAMSVNGHAVKNIAAVCKKINAFFVSISTNYVFDGTKLGQYLENDLTSPLQVYGESKLLGERLTLNMGLERVAFVRTSGLFGSGQSMQKGMGFFDRVKNAIEKKEMAGFPSEQITSVTYIPHLAFALTNMVADIKKEKRIPKILHITNSEAASWYGFASYIARKKNYDGFFGRNDHGKDHRGFLRPINSSLSSLYAGEYGWLQLPTWREAIDEFYEKV